MYKNKILNAIMNTSPLKTGVHKHRLLWFLLMFAESESWYIISKDISSAKQQKYFYFNRGINYIF